jgi:hypothetical protein
MHTLITTLSLNQALSLNPAPVFKPNPDGNQWLTLGNYVPFPAGFALGLACGKGAVPVAEPLAQVSLEAHSAVRVFPAYAGRPKSLTGFPRAVLWTGTVLLTIAHNLFATAFINSPLL